MDGLSGLLSTIGGWLGQGANAQTGAMPNWTKLVTGGLLGAGELGNILEENKRNAYQNYVLNLMKNPAALAQMVTKAEQPLSQSLIQNVENTVQGNVASRGLAQAPGIFATQESQALAPFVQQNQQQAQNLVLSSLGLPQGTFQNPTNLSPAMQLFLQSFGFRNIPGLNTGTPTGVPQQTQAPPSLTWPATPGVQPGQGGWDISGDIPQPTLPGGGPGY